MVVEISAPSQRSINCHPVTTKKKSSRIATKTQKETKGRKHQTPVENHGKWASAPQDQI